LAFRQNEGFHERFRAEGGLRLAVVGRLIGGRFAVQRSRAVPSAHQQDISPKLPASLRADCSRCAGLCCVVPAFYSVQGFAFDKPAYSACKYLTLENRCAIHTGLAARGFSGCVAFDCYGAGQRVTQELFNGMSWRTLDETALQNERTTDASDPAERLARFASRPETRSVFEKRFKRIWARVACYWTCCSPSYAVRQCCEVSISLV
jgi:hypothetical protein